MAIVKSLAVGNGDMFYIRHNSENFTIIDCNLTADTAEDRIKELAQASQGKEILRFISTHPDQDHFGGVELLDAELPIQNFYVVQNQAQKDEKTESFKHYCRLRDDMERAFYIHKGCSSEHHEGKWNFAYPADIQGKYSVPRPQQFKEALNACNSGESYNNISPIIRYTIEDGASFLWLGDLATEFMEKISDSVQLEKTTVIFASHHGRDSGKIPDSWLETLDPQIIVIGEAPSRHLNYYTGYMTITQNRAGDITMECVADKIHFYVANPKYSHDGLNDESKTTFDNYVGSITVETAYTLAAKAA